MVILTVYLRSLGSGLMVKKVEEKKKTPSLEVTQESLERLRTNIRASNLQSIDQEMILGILDAFFKIHILLLTGKARIRSLLAKIYGLKTEKRTKKKNKEGSP